MVGLTTATPQHDGATTSPKRLAVGILGSVTSLWCICTRSIRRASRKCSIHSPRSPLTSPKRLLATISNKAIQFRRKKRVGEEYAKEEEEGFGDGGLWQREILMGDKCQPLDFSGAIYYNGEGKRLNELPVRSPRASPLPSYAYRSAN